jgi:uncharacterized membrane protein
MTAQQSTQPLPTRPRQPERQRSWPIPAALVALSFVPVLAGALRLLQLAGAPALMPADHRFADFPLPLVVHIVGATTYALVGALQFVPRFRRRHLNWHRRTGRILTVAGLLVAISALWMTLFYERQPGTGDLLYLLRLMFGSAMAACLILGVATIRRGDIAAHRAWMIRAYAIGLAAGTQAFTIGVGAALIGTGGIRGDLGSAAGWAINLTVAERLIRRPTRSDRRRSTVASMTRLRRVPPGASA